jgi:hypothetical protein
MLAAWGLKLARVGSKACSLKLAACSLVLEPPGSVPAFAETPEVMVVQYRSVIFTLNWHVVPLDMRVSQCYLGMLLCNGPRPNNLRPRHS